ncbi:protein bicaudal D-like [Ipomoea triloba]|uniref:protein bicaudal D-like n=1 Tax=Ipomoea triloba TaxID=35885 RepID=UPI00125E11D6|nr:protein bicaudal D-like [Ipomoea triloba]XP_031109176.1 protein bicaudal D-like [Ipomoea triloba]XP_031109177.1 protein bicaudal D-like [Ipomoea triloba]
MKKLFFFKSTASSSGNNLSPPSKDRQCYWEKPADIFEKSRSRKKILEDQNSGATPTLRRSLSLSSGSLNDGVVAHRDFLDGSGSQCRGNNVQVRKSGRRSSRGRPLMPERRPRAKCLNDVETSYKVRNDYGSSFIPHIDSSESSSHCSSNISSKVLDLYIDGEQEQEKSGSTNDLRGKDHADCECGGIQLPPRVQHTAPASPPPNTKKKKPKSQSFREPAGPPQLYISSWELMENGFGHESPRKLAKKVVERLSQSQLLAERSSKEFDADTPITIEDIYSGNVSRCPSVCSDSVSQNHYSINGLNGTVGEYHGEAIHSFQERNSFSSANCSNMGNAYAEEDSDSELYRKFNEADELAKVLSEDLEEQNFFQGRGLSVPALIQKIRSLTEEKLQMAIETSAALQGQITERASAKEEVRLLRAELDSQTQRLEKEKNDMQSSLEKELDRRSSEWSIKLERYRSEEHRLRERVRELAEQNVSLQREVSTLSEAEVNNRSRISYSEKQLDDLVKRVEKEREENQILERNVYELNEKYRTAHEDQDCIRRNYEDKVKECKDLHRSITRLQKTCSEQERTIDGLRVFYEEVSVKNSTRDFDNELTKLRMEQMRLVGVECGLRKEVESYRLEVDSLRHENINLLNRLKGAGRDAGFSTFKLDQELQNRVSCLENQGLSLLKESTLVCEKLFDYIKANAGDTFKDGLGNLDRGLDGQFIVESDVKILGFKRGVDTLMKSLQNVSVVLHEKSESRLPSLESKIHQLNGQKPEDIMQSELKAETLLTSLLREKLYTKELDMEQLQAELAASVRGNDMLKCELQNARDTLSCVTYKMKDLELQMIKKDDNINQLQNNLQECMKELTVVKGILPKVSQERDVMWEEVKQYSEKNMLLNSEINALKKKIETLEEDILLKEGQITILKDTLGKPFDLLSSSGSTRDFMLD